MALTETAEVTQTVKPDGQIEVSTVIIIMRDGEETGRLAPHGYVNHPGKDLTNEIPETKRLGEFIHTPEVIAAYEAALAVREAADIVSQ